jgi:hypothetical protein
MDERLLGNNDTHYFGDVTNDFTLEFWIKRQFPDSITNWQTSAAAATGYCVSGVADDSLDDPANLIFGSSGTRRDGAGIQVRGANFEMFYQDLTGPTFVSRTFTLGYGWHHVAGTFDRDGNMETFVDGTSFGVNDISGAPTWEGNEYAIAQYCNIAAATAASGKLETPYALAGMAFHDTILTDAQIRNAAESTSLNTLGANTFFAFFVKDIQRAIGTGWAARTGLTGTQGSTTGIFTTTLRDDIATITADARQSVVEVSAANTDTDDGGLAGAIQLEVIRDTAGTMNSTASPESRTRLIEPFCPRP